MDGDAVVRALLLALPVLWAVVLLGGATVGWWTERDNWVVRLVFPRRHTRPGVKPIRRARRTAVAGAAVLAIAGIILLVPQHWAPSTAGLVWLPLLFVRIGVMKTDAIRGPGPEPLPPGAPRTSSDPVQLQTPNWHGPTVTRDHHLSGQRTDPPQSV